MTSKIDYDEVLFEIKDATEYATLHADAFRAAMREREMLRAEREVWANIAQERNDLRAEVERLRAEVVRLDDLADDRLMEVERLRAALLHVIDGVGGPDAIGWNTECPTCIAARDLVKPME